MAVEVASRAPMYYLTAIGFATDSLPLMIPHCLPQPQQMRLFGIQGHATVSQSEQVLEAFAR